MLLYAKYVYIFNIGHQLTKQNNVKYCPETLTGTAFSMKIAISLGLYIVGNIWDNVSIQLNKI